jgi:hypothetical protein
METKLAELKVVQVEFEVEIAPEAIELHKKAER